MRSASESTRNGKVAQRNGARLASTDTNSSHPATGRYHSAAIAIFPSIAACTVSQVPPCQVPSPAAGVPDTWAATTPNTTNPTTSESAQLHRGTATNATNSFDSTVLASDTGRLFQKRMLRSRRSVNRESSR